MNDRAMNDTEDPRLRRVDELWRRRPTERFVRASLCALGLLLFAAWPLAGFEWGELLTPRRLQNLERFLSELRPFPLQGESWSWPVAARWALDLLNRRGWEAARTTLAISICASLLAGGLGYGLALLASRSLAVTEPYAEAGRTNGGEAQGVGRTQRWARFAWAVPRIAIRGLLMGLRSIPEYVWAFLLLAILGPSAWPAVLALAIHNTGILGRLGAETFENAERAAPAALRGIGASRGQIVGLALLPAAFGRLLLYFFYRWETCVREATVLGLLGIVSLGYWIEEARVRGQYDVLFAWVLLGVVIVLLGDLVSLWARRVARRAT
jgi:phosphonate transport system permease protein